MLGPDSVPHAGNEAQVLLVEDTPSLALVYHSALAMADIKVGRHQGRDRQGRACRHRKALPTRHSSRCPIVCMSSQSICRRCARRRRYPDHARHFLDLYAREEKKAFGDFDSVAERMIRDHDWPGNVRQLQNVLRSAIVLQNGDVLTGELLQPALGAVDGPAETLHPAVGTRAMPTSAAEAVRRIQPLSTVERNAIEEAIALCGGNVPRAAAFLEVSPSTLYRKRQSWAHEAS